MSDDDDSSMDLDDMSDRGENDGDDSTEPELDRFTASSHKDFINKGFKGPHADSSLYVGRNDSTRNGISNLSAKYKFPTLEKALEAATKDPNCYGVTQDSDSAPWTLRGGAPDDYEEDEENEEDEGIYNAAHDLDEKSGCTSWTKDPNFLNFEDQDLLEKDCNFAGKTLFRPNFIDTKLHNPSFKNCILVDADFTGAVIFDGDFTGMTVVGDINFGTQISEATKFVNKPGGNEFVGILGLDLNTPLSKPKDMDTWAVTDSKASEEYEIKLDEIQREKVRVRRRQSLTSADIHAQDKTDIDVVLSSETIRVVLNEDQSSQYQGKTLIAPIFNGVTFTNANFSNCILIGAAEMHTKSTYLDVLEDTDGARFKDCTFAGTGDRCFADFTKTTFSGGVDFSNVVFHGPDDYVKQQYGLTDANGNNYGTNETTTSKDTTPSVGADFIGAKFYGLADFRRSQFRHVATFAAANFVGGFTFSKAVFRGQHTSFDDATFYAPHRFLKIEEVHEEHFLATQFLSKGYNAEENSDNIQIVPHGYKNAQYTGETEVVVGTSFVSARFAFGTLGSLGFQLAIFKYFANFEDIRIHSLDSILFWKTAFKGGVSFQDSEFGGNQEFRARSMEAVATKNHRPRTTDDVEFTKGDILIQLRSAGWDEEYYATNPRTGKSGLCPSDTIDLEVHTHAGPHDVLHIDLDCRALVDNPTDESHEDEFDYDDAVFKQGDVLTNVREYSLETSGWVIVTNDDGETGICSADNITFDDSSRACLLTGFTGCSFGGEITSFKGVTFNAITTSFKEATFASKITTFKECTFPVSDPDGIWGNTVTIDLSKDRTLGVAFTKNPATDKGAVIKRIDSGGQFDLNTSIGTLIKVAVGQIITHVNDTDVTDMSMTDIKAEIDIKHSTTVKFTLETPLSKIAESFAIDDTLEVFGALGEGASSELTDLVESKQQKACEEHGVSDVAGLIEKLDEALATLVNIRRDAERELLTERIRKTRTSFERATFTGIDFVDFRELNFGNAQVDFSDAKFTKCREVAFTECEFGGNARFRNAVFDIAFYVNFNEVIFSGGFDFYNAKFRGDGTTSFVKTVFNCLKATGHQILARVAISSKHCNFQEAIIGGGRVTKQHKKRPTAQPEKRGAKMMPLLGALEKVGVWEVKDIGCRVKVKDLGTGFLHFVGMDAGGKPKLGIELDLPKGDHNGTVKKAVYFKATAQHGVLVPLAKVLHINTAAAAAAAAAAASKQETVINHFNVTSTTADFRGCQFNKCTFFGVDLGPAQLGLSNSHNRTSLKDVVFTFSTLMDKTSGLEQALLPSHLAQEITTLAGAILEHTDDFGIDKCIKIRRMIAATHMHQIKTVTDFVEAFEKGKLGFLDEVLEEEELKVLRDKLHERENEAVGDDLKSKKSKKYEKPKVFAGIIKVTENSKKFSFAKVTKAAKTKKITFSFGAGEEAIAAKEEFAEKDPFCKEALQFSNLKAIAAETNAIIVATDDDHDRDFLNYKIVVCDSTDDRTGSFTSSSNITTGEYKVHCRIYHPPPIEFGAVGDTCCKIPTGKVSLAWTHSGEVLGLHKKEIEFALDHLHRLHVFTLDSNNWQEFRDAWYLVENFASSSMNGTLRRVLNEIIKPAAKSANVLGHTWNTPTIVLDRIETLSMCFSRSGPPAGVSNALKSVGRELKTKEYLRWVKELNEEIENIDTIVETKSLVWGLLSQIFLSFLIGLATFASNLAYDEFMSSFGDSNNGSFVVSTVQSGASAAGIGGD